MTIIVLNYETSEVDILKIEPLNPGWQVEDIEEILVEKGYSLSNIDWMCCTEELKINIK